MEHEMNLPFEVGQLVEVRSFEAGFRGAWFRCKIREIDKKRHLLEYIDFTDEKLAWTTLYQVAFTKGKHRELMVRPPYPPIYNEKQMPRVGEITEVTVIGGDLWRVGDLVDWWTSDSYWSGRITQLLGDDEAQIDLTPPPLGEGSSYKGLLKDLRPSLDWSPEHGWTVPTQEDDTGHRCARIIKPVNQGCGSTLHGSYSLRPRPQFISARRLRNSFLVVIDRINQVEDLHNAGQETASGETSARPLFSSPVSSNPAVADAAKSRAETEMPARSLGKPVSKKWKNKQKRSPRPGPNDSSTKKPSRVEGDSGHNGADPAAAVSDAEKSRTETEVPACSLGKPVSKKWKNKRKRSPRPGPNDSSTRKPSRVVSDSGHNGADPAAAVSDAEKSRTETEVPACSLGKPVSKKWKNKRKRSPRPGPNDSSTRKPSKVVADSGHNGAAVSDAATEMPACSLGKPVSKKQKHKRKRSTRPRPADHSTRKPSKVVADSGHDGADPAAAEIAEEELNRDNCQEKNSASDRSVVLPKGSDSIEAAILALEEYVNKVKWLKKLVRCGISSSDTQVPQWEFVEEISY
ncbi:uncharacterized protein LOC130991282 isoform X2 [Salvia miltiorrhiza]|uniref:uncharacterized protein LOC130991282 isoform X2 n=1 Tax=Salvia miltiorrhiza TaxID=226208 RepID=UPI0025ABF9A5|nr:uncharacterized protein LOC130991282 isoform X2 [Salvia miltiorrhiza]